MTIASIIVSILMAVSPACSSDDDPSFCHWQSDNGYDFVNVPFMNTGFTFYGDWNGDDQPEHIAPIVIRW